MTPIHREVPETPSPSRVPDCSSGCESTSPITRQRAETDASSEDGLLFEENTDAPPTEDLIEPGANYLLEETLESRDAKALTGSPSITAEVVPAPEDSTSVHAATAPSHLELGNDAVGDATKSQQYTNEPDANLEIVSSQSTRLPSITAAHSAGDAKHCVLDSPNTESNEITLPELCASTSDGGVESKIKSTANQDDCKTPTIVKNAEGQDIMLNSAASDPNQACANNREELMSSGSPSIQVLELELHGLLSTFKTLPGLTDYIDPSAELEKIDEATALSAAFSVNQRHIKLLHQYNEIRDIGMGLMGLIAEARGVRIRDIQEEFGIGVRD